MQISVERHNNALDPEVNNLNIKCDGRMCIGEEDNF